MRMIMNAGQFMLMKTMPHFINKNLKNQQQKPTGWFFQKKKKRKREKKTRQETVC